MENKKQNINDELLQAILDNKASRDQEVAFQKWIEEHPDHSILFDKMKQAWNAQKAIHIFSQIDVDADWQKVMSKSKKHNSKKHFRKFLNIAASILVLISIGFSYLYHTTPGFGKLSSLRSNNKATNITLADGSKIFLNKNSKIIYPNHFDSESRKIKMEGEAYFNVKSDSSKPFIIETKSAIIKVLGTSFNVKTNKNNKITVCVHSGKVSLENKKSNEIVFLTKGEKGVVKDTIVTESKNTEVNFDAWKTGVLRFKNTPVPLMFKYLENFYHVKITNRCRRIENLKFNSVFNNVDINKVIQELEMHLRVKITKKRNHLIITENNK
jgi:ferric-dicitrate binding protein FerR (iron transport regulator)